MWSIPILLIHHFQFTGANTIFMPVGEKDEKLKIDRWTADSRQPVTSSEQPVTNPDAFGLFKIKNLKFTFVGGYATVLCCFYSLNVFGDSY
jgi:hypothetical protein